MPHPPTGHKDGFGVHKKLWYSCIKSQGAVAQKTAL